MNAQIHVDDMVRVEIMSASKILARFARVIRIPDSPSESWVFELVDPVSEAGTLIQTNEAVTVIRYVPTGKHVDLAQCVNCGHQWHDLDRHTGKLLDHCPRCLSRALQPVQSRRYPVRPE